MAKTIVSPIAARTRAKHRHIANTKITKPKNMFAVTVNLIRLSKSQLAEALGHVLIEPPKYNLRKKINSDPPKKTAKKRMQTKSVTAICEKEQMSAERLWSVLKKEQKGEIVVNMNCLAKMRTYSPWPSKVLQTNKKTTKVYFFGDGTTGTVSTNEVVPAQHCVALMKKLFHLDRYIRAVREMEIYLGIPQIDSITKSHSHS